MSQPIAASHNAAGVVVSTVVATVSVESRCSLTRLSANVVHSVIAPYLSLDTVMSLCRVCRSYRHLFDSEPIWVACLRRDFTAPDIALATTTTSTVVEPSKSAYRNVLFAVNDLADRYFLPPPKPAATAASDKSSLLAAPPLLPAAFSGYIRFGAVGVPGVGRKSLFHRFGGNDPFGMSAPPVLIAWDMIVHHIRSKSCLADTTPSPVPLPNGPPPPLILPIGEWGTRRLLWFAQPESEREFKRSFDRSYYSATHVMWFCYAVNDRESFRAIRELWKTVTAVRTPPLSVLVAMKADLPHASDADIKRASATTHGPTLFRVVSTAEGEALARELGMPLYGEVSARANSNFIRLTRRCVKWYETTVLSKPKAPAAAAPSKSSCIVQ